MTAPDSGPGFAHTLAAVPTEWIAAGPHPVDSRDVVADVVALRSAWGSTVPMGAPLAAPGPVATAYDPDPAALTGAGVLAGHLLAPLDLAGVTAPTVAGRIITRGVLVASRLATMTAFVPPVESKRAPSIEYV